MSQLDFDTDPWASLLSDGETVWIHDHDHPMLAQGLFGHETLPILDVDGEILQAWLIDWGDRQFYADACEEAWGQERPTPVAMPLYSAGQARYDAIVGVCLVFKTIVRTRCPRAVLVEILRCWF